MRIRAWYAWASMGFGVFLSTMGVSLVLFNGKAYTPPALVLVFVGPLFQVIGRLLERVRKAEGVQS